MTAMMAEDDFWALMETARAARGNDTSDAAYDKQIETLRHGLEALKVEDLIAFERRMWHLHHDAYAWVLWGAAYLLNGGCSDDGFIDFRYELIGEGRDVYARAVANPDTLANLPYPLVGYEQINYVAMDVYEAKTGNGFDLDFSNYSQDPAGEDFDFDDDELMAARYPNIWKKMHGEWADL